MTRRPVAGRPRRPQLDGCSASGRWSPSWNLLYSGRGPSPADPGTDDGLEPRRPLAEGLGHCGGCHTPRNGLGAEQKAARLRRRQGRGLVRAAAQRPIARRAPWTPDQAFHLPAHRPQRRPCGRRGPDGRGRPRAGPRAASDDVRAIASTSLADVVKRPPAAGLADGGSRRPTSPPGPSEGRGAVRRRLRGLPRRRRADDAAGPAAARLGTPLHEDDPRDTVQIILHGLAAGRRGGPDDAGLRRRLTDAAAGRDRRLPPVPLQRSRRGPTSPAPSPQARKGAAAMIDPQRQRPARTRSTPIPTRRCSTCCATSWSSTAPSSAAASASAAPARCSSTASAVFSCVMPVAALAGRAGHARVEGLGTPSSPGPLQRAFIDEQAAQCGYCIAGMIMRAQALLERNPAPDRGRDPRATWQPNLCRCGTHMRILRAVRRAAEADGRRARAHGA